MVAPAGANFRTKALLSSSLLSEVLNAPLDVGKPAPAAPTTYAAPLPSTAIPVPVLSVSVAGNSAEYTSGEVPVGLISVTKALHPLFCTAVVFGKSPEQVTPVRYALRLESTAIAAAPSAPLPPR